MDMSFDLKDILLKAPGTIYWKGVDGFYLGCNQNQAEILGYSSPDDIVGKNLSDLLPPELVPAHEENDRKVFESGQEQIFEERGLGPKGSILTYLSRKIPFRDENGEVIGLLGISSDITEYKQNEEKLSAAKREAEENLGKIVNFLPGNIFWKDKSHRFLGCNEHLAKLVKLNSPQEIIGKKNIDLPSMTKEMAELAEANDYLVIEAGKEMVFEEQGFDANGKPATYLSRKIPLFEEGKVVGTLGIGLDITERKVFEQALRNAKHEAEIANKVKTDFLMNMSHDLRTPLSGVMGFLDVLISQEDDDEKKEMLGYAYQSSKRLLRIIEEIIDVVKQETEKIVECKPVNLSKIISGNCELLKPEVLRKGLNLTVKIDPELPEIIYSDKKRLDKLVLNLVTNAVKFTDKGFVNVSVNVTNKLEDKVEFEICVQDSGCGIEKESVEKIFDRFTRTENAARRTISGSGLGLWFVKNIIKDMGGHVFVESVIGKGSKFTCQISVKTSITSKVLETII